MLLNKMCFYSKILHAFAVLEHVYAVLEDAYAVLEQGVLLTGTCFYLENCGFGGVSNQDMLLI